MRLLEILSRMAVGLPSPPPILADQGITPTGPIRLGGQGVMPGPTGTPCRSDHLSPSLSPSSFRNGAFSACLAPFEGSGLSDSLSGTVPLRDAVLAQAPFEGPGLAPSHTL